MSPSCEHCRESISARFDHEAGPVPADELAEHLRSCPGCAAYEARVGALHRATRVRAAEAVPDLVGAILAATPVAGAPGRAARPVSVARWALGTLALTMVVVSLPVLLMPAGAAEGLHTTRELGAFQLALAVGLLTAAVQPSRAWGLLPLAGVLAAALVVTATVDVLAGFTSLQAESIHLLEVAGIGLLWWVGRQEGHDPSPRVVPRRRLAPRPA